MSAADGIVGESSLRVRNLHGIHEDDGNQEANEQFKHEPMDVQVMKMILESMGSDKYEPRVVNQLQEFVHRYVTDVLVDAQEYSVYANKPSLDSDDIRLAISSRMNHQYALVPPRELVMELAEKRNSLALPPISNEYGVRLPPPNHQLITFESVRQDQFVDANGNNPQNNGENSSSNHNQSATGKRPGELAMEGTRNKKQATMPITIKLKSPPSTQSVHS